MKKIRMLILMITTLLCININGVYAQSNNKIDILKESNYIQGYENGDLGLDNLIKRSEMTKLVVNVYGNENDIKKSGNEISVFKDVKNDYWAKSYINYAANNKLSYNGQYIITGDQNGNFLPEKNLDAAELSKILVVLSDKGITKNEISDLNSKWPMGWINKASDVGIFEGLDVPDKNKSLDRKTAFEMYYNSLEKLGNLPKKKTENYIKKTTKLDNSRLNNSNKKFGSRIDYSVESNKHRNFDYINNPDKNKLIDFFVDAIQCGASSVTVDHYMNDNINGKEIITEDDMNYIIDSKMSNSLESWKYEASGYENGVGKSVYTFEYKDTIPEMQKAEDFMVKWVKINIKSTDSDEIKVRKIHDFIVDKVQYCEGDCGKIGNHSVYSNVSVILDGKAVCQGFGLTFQRMATLSGLDCIYVSGSAISDNGQIVNHGWNKVKVNGVWYNIDTTFDTPVCKQNEEDQKKRRIRNYYLISDEELFRTHSFNKKYYPESKATFKLN